MKVMVIVKASRASEAGEMPSEELLSAMGNFNAELADAGVMLAGEGLHPSSKGVRVTFSGKDRTVIKGPFTETEDLIAGFWIWQVKSMDDAIAWVKRCPNPHPQESVIEIRQVFSAEDFGAEFTPELREQEAGIRAKALGLGAVRFENAPDMLIAGINESYSPATRAEIPQQWRRFGKHLGKVPGQVGKMSYGVCWNFKANAVFDYLSGVEVSDASALPPDFATVSVPARRYAVFTHDGHISEFPQTIDTIWKKWVPESGLKPAQAPCVERYTENYDAKSGRGGIELWIPLES